MTNKRCGNNVFIVNRLNVINVSCNCCIIGAKCSHETTMNHKSSPETRRIASAALNGHRDMPSSSSTSTHWSISSAGSLPVLCKPDVGENRQASASTSSIVISMRNEIDSLKKELTKSRDLVAKMQEREKHLRERYITFHGYDYIYIYIYIYITLILSSLNYTSQIKSHFRDAKYP